MAVKKITKIGLRKLVNICQTYHKTKRVSLFMAHSVVTCGVQTDARRTVDVIILTMSQVARENILFQNIVI